MFPSMYKIAYLVELCREIAGSCGAFKAGRSGTGSKPPAFHGWQRLILRIPSHAPRIAPYSSMASWA